MLLKKTKPIIVRSLEELKDLGITHEVKMYEDGFRTNKDKGFFEWWYFDAHFDDESTAVIVFMTKPINEYKSSLRPGVIITINRKDGTKISKFLKFSKEDFISSKDKCDVLIGSNWVKGDLKEYNLHAEIDDIKIDLLFEGIVPAWRPRDGQIFFGDRSHYFAWLASIPHGTVKGTLVYDGIEHKVKGFGYHDHNWGNISLPAIQDHWYWGRAILDDFTVIFVEQIASKKYGSKKLPVFMLAKGDRILIEDGNPLTLELSDFTLHSSKHKYPNKLVFKWKKGNDKVIITLTNPRIIEAATLLGSFPKWKQFIARIFVNPYYFRFESEVKLEINYKDIKTVKTGSTLYELMQLR